jgi:beta-galactosidase
MTGNKSSEGEVRAETILYGASYYHEYMPHERLERDIELMTRAGLSVVRVGESTWSLWEPEEGRFEHAWMDRIVNAMHAAGIKVIIGTPSYSIPPWMCRRHPEILARRTNAPPTTYGMRQNMNTDSPAYRFYAERIIRRLVAQYRDHPAVIAWQIDNETASYGATNDDVFAGFVDHLKGKFDSPEALNRAWLLNYWGQSLSAWEDLTRQDTPSSTGYRLEWTRWSQMRVTHFLAWQAALVRELKRPDQLVIHNFSPGVHADVNERAVARVLDVVGSNPYHATQDRFDGHTQTFNGDFYRSLRRDSYWVTEINAQTIGWSSAHQFPPYDGQARLDVYSHLASGADLVAYWHWHSLHSGIETYWKGVLGHDLEPNRFYAEVTATARELNRIGPRLAGLRKTNEVAILYSVDSLNALEIMPITAEGHEPDFMPWMRRKSDYVALLQQVHRAFYDLNVEVDFAFPDAAEFTGYRLLVVPALYVADHALLLRIAAFVKAGGHVLMTFKSGVADENSRVRHIRLPGPLREAAGVSYQEFSTLERPLALKGDPFAIGADGNHVMYWAEFLETESAEPLAYYDHPFFGRWPALTRNRYGDGSLTYIGSWPSQALLLRIAFDALQSAGVNGAHRDVPGRVRLKRGVNRHGKKIRYYLNYSPDPQLFSCGPCAAANLITGDTVMEGREIGLEPWGVAILEES